MLKQAIGWLKFFKGSTPEKSSNAKVIGSGNITMRVLNRKPPMLDKILAANMFPKLESTIFTFDSVFYIISPAYSQVRRTET